jgi:hypothetical protein
VRSAAEVLADVPCESLSGCAVHVCVRGGRVELLAEPCILTSQSALRIAAALVRAVRATDPSFENRNTETMLAEAEATASVG